MGDILGEKKELRLKLKNLEENVGFSFSFFLSFWLFSISSP